MNITLPDGTTKQFDGPVTGAQLAESIGPGLLRAAVAVEVDGVQLDLSVPIVDDAAVKILTLRDADGLDVMRHTLTAQVLARAIRDLYPGSKLAIGPTVANGFYYDVELEKPLLEGDLEHVDVAEVLEVRSTPHDKGCHHSFADAHVAATEEGAVSDLMDL